MSRFLKYLFWLVLLIGVPWQGNASLVPMAFPKGDGKLTLYHLNLDEKIAVRFREGGDYRKKALAKINHVLRCRGDGKATMMAVKLIELIDHLQDHFGVKEIHVISGYRSPHFNARLRNAGRGVARHSRHMKGEAIDIRLPGVSIHKVRSYLLSLKAGGVGYYPGQNFVHIDVGPFRSW